MSRVETVWHTEHCPAPHTDCMASSDMAFHRGLILQLEVAHIHWICWLKEARTHHEVTHIHWICWLKEARTHPEVTHIHWICWLEARTHPEVTHIHWICWLKEARTHPGVLSRTAVWNTPASFTNGLCLQQDRLYTLWRSHFTNVWELTGECYQLKLHNISDIARH